jgi:hypothetical protein
VNTRQQTSYEPNASKPASKERSAKLTILKTCQLLFSKDLSEPEMDYWISLMDGISVSVWRQAFDNWQRNGRFFPKPKDILELCEIYGDKAKPTRIVFPHHGEGYGSADIDWLWKAYANKRSCVNHRALNDEEVNALLDELDKKRGHSPAWRTA